MSEIADRLNERTMRFALRVVRFSRTLRGTWEGRHAADQLFRAGTSVAANSHAACRARSRREFASKIGLVVEEADESVFWVTFAGLAGLAEGPEQKELLRECRELLAIFTASAKTASRPQSALHNQHSAIT